MLSKLWRWIEVVLMIVGFMYTLILVVAFVIMMAPILILFERRSTKKPKELEKANGTKNQESPQ